MNRAALPILAVIALAAPAAAVASPLSMARGRAAIARFETRYNGTVTHCWRDRQDRPAVYCAVVENITTGVWAGWQWHTADVATLHGSRLRVRGVV